ncbi:hypothetical protein [Legionella clemsonensis]|uniref:Uncharacterized protein n=1 Tax=Legionella clemsonensis TaxID=1867846 RepID=A0A222P063_9GAMM|nr:hypothetical protein [Legionella clemsonensis]ASQ45253.1 hypothetical protein clem_03475 [Legionella clemsonensis]
MRKYNSEEALLYAWRQKLNTIDTKREPLKKELLTLLDDVNANSSDRLIQFNKRKNTLLGDEHQQGWSWTANLNWLWNFISFISFGYLKLNSQPGSRLREALLITPEVDNQLVTIDSNAIETIFLDDSQFEAALFSEPQKALQDFRCRLQRLKKAEDTKENLQIIERLDALKRRLPPQDYQNYLIQLFEHAPKECLTYYYALYQKENIQDQYEFIESYLLAETLIKLYVSPEKDISAKENSHPFIFAAQELIILLSFLNSGINKIDPIKQILAESSFSPTREDLIRESIYLQVKKQILDVLEKKIDSTRFKYTSYDTPLKIIKDLYEYVNPKPHPLLMQVTRLVTEVLIRTHYNVVEEKQKEWSSDRLNYQTLNFFAGKILQTWPSDFHINSVKDNTSLLNPHQYASGIMRDYQPAEKHAVAILVSGSLNIKEGLKTARRIRCESQLTQLEKDWIVRRVLSVYPHLKPQLNSVLNKLVIFNSRNLSTTQENSFADMSATTLIALVDNNLKVSQDLQDIDKENEINNEALHALHHLITHCQLDIEQLSFIYHQLLPRCKEHCISEELFKYWQQQIKKQQSELLRFNATETSFKPSELELLLKENTEIATILNNYQEPFQRILMLCSHLQRLVESLNFSAAKDCARLAVNNFASLLDTLVSTSSPLTKKEVANAIMLLKDNLQPYLSEKQYASWYSKLLNFPSSHASSTEVVFFHAASFPEKPSDKSAEPTITKP